MIVDTYTWWSGGKIPKQSIICTVPEPEKGSETYTLSATAVADVLDKQVSVPFDASEYRLKCFMMICLKE